MRGKLKVGFRNFIILSILVFTYSNLFAFISLRKQQCDSYVKKVEYVVEIDGENKDLGYQPLNGRCEGVYLRDWHESLLLVSFIEYIEEYDFGSNQDLIAEWASPDNKPVYLQAEGMRSLQTTLPLYYRMNSVQGPGIDSFSWPIKILKALQIKSHDIGVVGWTDFNIGKSSNRLYLPIRIKQKGTVEQFNSYTVAIFPRQELTEVSYSIAKLEDAEIVKLGPYTTDSKNVEISYYRAERIFQFPISLQDSPGIYLLEIGATLKSGAVDTIELWIYQSR